MNIKTWKTVTFHNFCAWLNNHPENEVSNANLISDTKIDEYENFLIASGESHNEVKMKSEFIQAALMQIDIQKWNERYAESDFQKIVHSPNLFMTEIVENLPAGKVLDVGMGLGRNLIYLSRKGWTVTGIEASKEGYDKVKMFSEVEKLDINAVLTNYENYDFGKDEWDLVLLLYVPFRNIAERVIESLAENGSLIVEAYHTDARRFGKFGDKVTFKTGELIEMFAKLKIYKYGEVTDFSDFGEGKVPIVRLYAGKSTEQE